MGSRKCTEMTLLNNWEQSTFYPYKTSATDEAPAGALEVTWSLIDILIWRHWCRQWTPWSWRPLKKCSMLQAWHKNASHQSATLSWLCCKSDLEVLSWVLDQVWSSHLESSSDLSPAPRRWSLKYTPRKCKVNACRLLTMPTRQRGPCLISIARVLCTANSGRSPVRYRYSVISYSVISWQLPCAKCCWTIHTIFILWDLFPIVASTDLHQAKFTPMIVNKFSHSKLVDPYYNKHCRGATKQVSSILNRAS